MSNKLIVGGVAVAVLVSVVAYFGQPDTDVIDERMSALETMVNGVRVIAEKLGATPGTDFSGDTISVGGIRYHYKNVAFKTATTTPCALQTPAATTSLLWATVNVKQSTSTNVTYILATSTTAFATTSQLIDRVVVPANQTRAWDTGSATRTQVMATSTWLVLGANKASTGGYDPISLSGSCTFLFQELP